MECGLWSVRWEVGSVKSRVWGMYGVECKVWSVKYGSMEWGVGSVECKVWSG